jgi:hypothetical protein
MVDLARLIFLSIVEMAGSNWDLSKSRGSHTLPISALESMQIMIFFESWSLGG